MHPSIQKIQNLNIEIYDYFPLESLSNLGVAKAETVGSKKSAYRKFVAENNQQPPSCCQESLSNQLKSGTLQQMVANKIIDPNTLIHQAILENSPEVIRFLLDHGVDVDYPDENGMSPLTIAILTQQPEIVRQLLVHGANVSPSKKWNDRSLIEISLNAGDLKSAGYLIQNGVDVNTVFKDGYTTALDYAFESEHYELVNILLDSNRIVGSSLNRALIRSLYFTSNEMLLKLLTMGADANFICKNTATLDIVCSRDYREHTQYRYLEKARILLEHGANPNLVHTSDGVNPTYPPTLIQACDDVQLIKLLFEFKADPNQVLIQKRSGIPYESHSALIRVITLGTPESALERVKLLVEAGAAINKKIDGVSPLEHALSAGRMDVVKYLLLKGAKA